MASTTDQHPGQAACTALFANDDWSVSADGLEHRGSGYFIERSSLDARRRDGLWSWPMQVAEKSWYAPRLFHDAFMRALELFGLTADADLARSLALASETRTGSGGRATDGFVALGDLLRPRSNQRKRPVSSETRMSAARRNAAPGRHAASGTA